MVARNKDKLERVKAEILAENPKLKVKILVKDFQHALDDGFYAEFEKLADELDVSVVVNDVGVAGSSTKYEELFLTGARPEFLRELVAVNMVSQPVLHKIFTPKFLARKSRCAFVDVSSIFSMYCGSVFENYSSSKDFGRYLTNSLAAANKDSNIDYLSHQAGKIATNITAPTVFKLEGGQQPYYVVSELMKSLGVITESSGCWEHILTQLAIKNVGIHFAEYAKKPHKWFMEWNYKR